ncbi:MAG: ornithine--oxo-acid transaminase [Alphaproteobacteria bacterium]|nr:ornithine--oxo-acid transaminase [Alphaproteobacteria bacterium]
MTDNRDLEAQYCARNYAPLPVTLAEGRGAWLVDEDGKRYLDMMSAYSAVSHGHAHPRLVRVLTEQASRLAMTSRAFRTGLLGPFLEKLCQVSGMDMALPMNTGAEAVETAIKAARRWGYRVKGIAPGRAEIVVASGNFHGRTTTIVGFSSDADYRADFGPFTPGFREAPFGDAVAFEKALGPNTCAVLVEPIQGEAGVVVPPEGWLRALRRACDRHNVLLILDEIQSGLGRTGKMFAFEHEGVRPDGLIVGKALGGGLLPVSAFLARRDVMELFEPGSHGSTFGGNPLAAAVALEALKVLEDEKLVERSAELGAYLIERLRAVDAPGVRSVRGRGLWVGVEIEPSFASARQVCELLMTKSVLSKETHDTVVRFAPPFVVTRAEIDWAVDRFAETLREIGASRPARVDPAVMETRT